MSFLATKFFYTFEFYIFGFDTFKRGDFVDKLHHHKLGIFGVLNQQKPRIATLIISHYQTKNFLGVIAQLVQDMNSYLWALFIQSYSLLSTSAQLDNNRLRRNGQKILNSL